MPYTFIYVNWEGYDWYSNHFSTLRQGLQAQIGHIKCWPKEDIELWQKASDEALSKELLKRGAGFDLFVYDTLVLTYLPLSKGPKASRTSKVQVSLPSSKGPVVSQSTATRTSSIWRCITSMASGV